MIPGTNITWTDGVVAIIIVAFLIHGLAKGAVKQLFGFISVIVVVAASVMLAKVAAQLLAIPFGGAIENSIVNWIEGLDSAAVEGDRIFTVVKDWTLESNVVGALITLGVPSWGSGLLQGAVYSTFAGFGQAKLVDVLPPVFASWILTAIGFILLIIIFTIVVLILKNIFVKATEKGAVKGIDRLLGMAIGAVVAYIIVCGLLLAIQVIPGGIMDGVRNSLNNQIEQSIWTKFLYENNLLGAVVFKIS